MQVVIGERGWLEVLVKCSCVPHTKDAGVLDRQTDAFFAELPARDLAIIALQEAAELMEPGAGNRDSYRRENLKVIHFNWSLF